MRRPFIGLGLSTAALLLCAIPAIAGGWATVTPDAASGPEGEPRAGEAFTLGFTVLQHGATPVSWVTVSVAAVSIEGGAELVFPARPAGAIGHYVAPIMLPEAGSYELQFRIQELVVESGPVLITVGTASGEPAPVSLSAVRLAEERLRTELTGTIGTVRDDLGARVGTLEATVAGLRTANEALIVERDALQGRVASLERRPDGSTGPAIGLLIIAALVGAVGGLAAVTLLRPPTGAMAGPTVTDPAT